MYDLKNGDIVITNSYIKEKILLYLSDNKIILDLNIMTLREFINKYNGYYNEEAIYYLMKKYDYKYEIAKRYLDNFNFIDSLKKELIDNNLLIDCNDFKNNIKRIVIINEYFIDPYLKDIFNNYETIYIDEPINNNNTKIYEFNSIEDEVYYNAINIIETLKNNKMDNIYLVNLSSEYNEVVRKIFGMLNIPLALDNKVSIYSSMEVQKFLANLKESKNIDNSLAVVKDDWIRGNIVDICNKYVFANIDDKIIECIDYELKNSLFSVKNKIKGVKNIDVKDINNEEAYYFILGFNETQLPRIHKDEDMLSDKQKRDKGLLTSWDKNNIEKDLFLRKIGNYSHISITYKLKSSFDTYYPSSLISKYNFEVVKNIQTKYNYSNSYNKIKLTSMLDDMIKYNHFDSDLNLLYSKYYDLPYLSYDNKFTGIDKNNFWDFIDNKLLLSYSSLDNYYRCRFKYYVKNVLKLDLYEDNFVAFIGSLFHYILSICFNDGFNYDKEFDKYIEDKVLSNKEYFFTSKLKEDLKFIIDTLKEQNNYTKLNSELYEQKIFINKDHNIKVTFMGIIDKIKYDDTINTVAIIDYKTGAQSINMGNVVYGLDMQLPIYIYLLKNSKFKNYKVAGFYLQKIIPPKMSFDPNKDEDVEKKKFLRLEGYSNSNTDILNNMDTTYEDSLLIKSMKMSSKGFYNYAKTISDDEIDTLVKMVDKNINIAISDIEEAKFDINPKQIAFNLKGCEYCTYKDLCYLKDSDIVKLKANDDLFGGDIDA